MKRIVIIGAGFAGLAAAKALRHAKADVLVIDRTNHNLFQPLLYQVATTVLSPAQIASPIRGLLKNQRNTTVFLGEVNGINKDAKFVYAKSENHQDVAHSYDILVIATGVGQSYFGRDEFAEFAPGLAPANPANQRTPELGQTSGAWLSASVPPARIMLATPSRI